MLFSRKLAVFALFCADQSGVDALLALSAIVHVKPLTNTSRTRIQITCNAQVAFRTVPRVARSCSICSTTCPLRDKTPTTLSPSLTPTSLQPFRRCVVRPLSTRSLEGLQSIMMAGGCSLVMPSPPSLRWDPSMVISEPCAVPPVSIATLITAVARTVSKAPLEVSRATAWR